MPSGARGGYAGALGWSVGLFSWLDNPNAKVNRYWRVIEQGSNESDWPWQGRHVVGLWGPNAGPRGALINGDLSGFQTGRNDQKFVPFFRSISDADNRRAARAALYYFFGGGKGRNMELLHADPRASTANGGAGRSVERARKRIYFWLMTRARVEDMPFVQGVIIREVPAGRYYARAALTFNPAEREMEELRRVMQHVFGAGGASSDPTTSAGLRKGREYQAADAYSKHGTVAPKKGRRRLEGGGRLHTTNNGSQGIVSVDSTAYVQDFIRTSRGTISQYTSEMTEVNRRVAAAFQAEVVQLMQQERRRPMSGALLKAHADPQNRTP